MGLKVSEILNTNFFKFAKVLAGENGLDRIVQGVTIQDAPTGLEWARDRDFWLTTGYLFKNNFDYLKKAIIGADKIGVAGIGIKIGRYIDELPEDVLRLADEKSLPIIDLPKDKTWMEFANFLNEYTLDRHIENLVKSMETYGNANYDMKINKIVNNLHKDIDNHIEIYDIYQDKVFSSKYPYSNVRNAYKYKKIWNVDSNAKVELLSEIINIKKIKSDGKETRIIIPIIIDDMTLAYMVVWENQNKNDYFDLYTIRLSLLLIMKEYGSIYFENSFKNHYKDEKLSQILNNDYLTTANLRKKLFNSNKKYFAIALNSDIDFKDFRNNIYRIIYRYLGRVGIEMGIVSYGEMAIILDEEGVTCDLRKKLNLILKDLNEEYKRCSFKMGIPESKADIKELEKNYKEAKNAIELSKYIYPNRNLNEFVDLGPFKNINLKQFKDENQGTYDKYIKPILDLEGGEELLNTLSIFFDSNQNYNLTSEKLYIHANTVRYRINKIADKLLLDFEDSFERLKLEIVLKFLDLFD